MSLSIHTQSQSMGLSPCLHISKILHVKTLRRHKTFPAAGLDTLEADGWKLKAEIIPSSLNPATTSRIANSLTISYDGKDRSPQRNMRKPLIAGNWKMYKTPKESLAFLEAFLPLVADHSRDEVLLFPSMTSLSYALDAVRDTNVHVGAQNMHWLNEGAYTGETSPTMLSAIGCRHVLLGHSEQRMYFNETSERVNLKLKAAFTHGFVPVVCVGELLNERQEGRTEEVLRDQLRIALLNVTAAEARSLVIAYEPVWAIGTGATATPDIANEAHAILRDELSKSCGGELAQATRILYGGSVKPDNIATLMREPEIDGALVGGASLNPVSFSEIVHYA